MQCSVNFPPTLSSVVGKVNQSRISVALKSQYADFEPTGSLQKVVMANLNLISRMSSHIGVSSLGVPPNTNSGAVRANHRKNTLAENVAQGAENLITALVDDLLVAQASTQVTAYSGIDTTQVQKRFNAVRLGSQRFIYVSLSVNVALVLFVLTRTVRTKVWQRLPAFDFTDLQSVMVAAMLSTFNTLKDQERASIKWLPNAAGDMVILVDGPVDLVSKSMQTSALSVNQKSFDRNATLGIAMEDRVPGTQ